jgi:hypothetical protein
MTTTRLCLPILLAAALAACGDDAAPAADAGPDASTATTVQSFCHDLSQRVCEGLASCGCRFDLRPYDMAGCVDARTSACAAGLGANVQADLDSGAAVFDEAAVQACLVAVTAEAQACVLAGETGLPGACNAFVVANVAIGQVCALTGGGLAMCASGAGVCAPDTHACTALPGDGQACLGDLCAPGLACDAGTCAPAPPPPARLADGQSCTDDGQCLTGHTCEASLCAPGAALGDACTSPHACGADRSCGRAPETRTCGTPDGVGAPCMDGTCAAGLACAQATMTCQTLPGADAPCLDNQCAAGLGCDDGTQTCKPLPGLGQPCAAGARFCADGLGCDQTTNTCVMPPGDGEACALNPPDYLCGPGLGCDFQATGSFCVPLRDIGDACMTDRTCLPGLYCEYSTNTCSARLPQGATCNDGNECQAGLECTPSPSDVTCQPTPAAGEPCTDVCVDGLACKGPGGECVNALCVIR